MKCDNFENEKCRYFEMLQGKGEELPTGCNDFDGRCNPILDHDGDWLDIEPEDCDMLDLEDGE